MCNYLEGQPAKLWRICVAMIYDGLLIVGCMIGVGFIAVMLNHTQAIVANTVKAYALSLSLLMTWFVFYIYFCSRQGQTLGMRAWKLVLVDRNGHIPTLACISLRWFIATMVLFLPFTLTWFAGFIDIRKPFFCIIILLLPIILSYALQPFDENKRNVLDKLSQTHLLQVKENPYPKTRRT